MPSVDPEFSREAGLVLQSPYFDTPSMAKMQTTDFQEYLKAKDQVESRKDFLFKAVVRCRSYKDLKGKAKELYDAAKATLEPADAEDKPHAPAKARS